MDKASIKIIDPKSEYSDIARKYPDFLLMRWNDLRFNPLTPPPNVPENEWFQTIVGHMSQCFNFWEGAESLLIRLLNKISKEIAKPAVLDLYKALREETPRFKQKDILVMGTVASRLELMLHTFKEVVITEQTMLERLHNRHYIIQTSGLMSEVVSWLVEFLLLWEFMYRVFNPSKRELAIHIYDECQHHLFNKEKEKNVKKISASIISMLIDEARSLNISIVALSQEPSVLLKSIRNNSYLKMAFHLGSGEEVKIMGQAMGLNRDQMEAMHYLETGVAIVRTAGGFMDAFPVMIDEFKAHTTNEKEFEKRQKMMREQLYKDSGIWADKRKLSTQSINADQIFIEGYDVL